MNKKGIAFEQEFNNLSMQSSKVPKVSDKIMNASTNFTNLMQFKKHQTFNNTSQEYFGFSPKKLSVERLWPQNSSKQQKKLASFDSSNFKLKEFSNNLLSQRKKQSFQVFQTQQAEKLIEIKRKGILEENRKSMNYLSLNNEISDFENQWNQLNYKPQQQNAVLSGFINQTNQLDKHKSIGQQQSDNYNVLDRSWQNSRSKTSFLSPSRLNIVTTKRPNISQVSNTTNVVENLRDWNNLNFLNKNEDESQQPQKQIQKSTKPTSIIAERNANELQTKTKSFIDTLFLANKKSEAAQPKQTYLTGFEEKFEQIQVPEKQKIIEEQNFVTRFLEKKEEDLLKTPFQQYLSFDKQSERQQQQKEDYQSFNEPNLQSPIYKINSSDILSQEVSPIKESPNLQRIKQLQEQMDKIQNYQEKKALIKTNIQQKAQEIKYLSQDEQTSLQKENAESLEQIKRELKQTKPINYEPQEFKTKIAEQKTEESKQQDRKLQVLQVSKKEELQKEQPQKEEPQKQEQKSQVQNKQESRKEENKSQIAQKEEIIIKEEPKKVEQQKEEIIKVETKKEKSKQEQIMKEEPNKEKQQQDEIKVETNKEKQQKEKEQIIKEESKKEMQLKEDILKVQPKKEKQQKEDILKVEANKEKQQKEDANKIDQIKGQEKIKQKQQKEQIIKEEPKKEEQLKEDILKEEPKKQKQQKEQIIKEEQKKEEQEEANKIDQINGQAVNILQKNMEEISTSLKKDIFGSIKSTSLTQKQTKEPFVIKKLSQNKVKGSTKLFFKLFVKYNSIMRQCFEQILATNLKANIQKEFPSKKLMDKEQIYQRILEASQSPPKKDKYESPGFEQSDIKLEMPLLPESKEKEKYTYNVKKNLSQNNSGAIENELKIADLEIQDSYNFSNIQDKFKTYDAEEQSVPYTMPNIESKGPTNFQNYIQSRQPYQFQRKEYQAKTTKESESKLKGLQKKQIPLQATLKELIQQQKVHIGNTFKQLTDASLSQDNINQSGSPNYKKSKTQYQ